MIQDATLPGSRSSAFCSDVMVPINPLRLVPRSMGTSSTVCRILAIFFRSSKFPRKSFAKPIPGSKICSHLCRECCFAAISDRRFNAVPTSSTMSPYDVKDCIVSGVPRICIRIIGTPSLSTEESIALSNVPPDTSFTMSAPTSTAASATAACRVSMEIATSDAIGLL